MRDEIDRLLGNADHHRLRGNPDDSDAFLGAEVMIGENLDGELPRAHYFPAQALASEAANRAQERAIVGSLGLSLEEFLYDKCNAAEEADDQRKLSQCR